MLSNILLSTLLFSINQHQFFFKCLISFLLQNALKGEDDMAPHTKEKPGNKRKSNKKSKSRKKSNTSPDGEVNHTAQIFVLVYFLFIFTIWCFLNWWSMIQHYHWWGEKLSTGKKHIFCRSLILGYQVLIHLIFLIHMCNLTTHCFIHVFLLVIYTIRLKVSGCLTFTPISSSSPNSGLNSIGCFYAVALQFPFYSHLLYSFVQKIKTSPNIYFACKLPERSHGRIYTHS